MEIHVMEFVNIMASFKFNYIDSEVSDKQPLKEMFIIFIQ